MIIGVDLFLMLLLLLIIMFYRLVKMVEMVLFGCGSNVQGCKTNRELDILMRGVV